MCTMSTEKRIERQRLSLTVPLTRSCCRNHTVQDVTTWVKSRTAAVFILTLNVKMNKLEMRATTNNGNNDHCGRRHKS